jgi:subtilisin-like proprotein convertase family protein
VLALAFLSSQGHADAGGFTFTVTRFDDPIPIVIPVCPADCSFREAVRAANAQPGHDTIILSAGTYTLSQIGEFEDEAATGDVDITDDVTINGVGAQSTFIFDGITDPEREFPEEIIQVHPGATVAISDLSIIGSAGILNLGDLTLDRLSIRNGTDTAVKNGGVLLMSNSTLSGNGNPWRPGGLLDTGNATVINSTITGNWSSALAGGIVSSGANTELLNVTVTNNSSLYADAGGLQSAGNVHLTNTIVAGNQGGDCTENPGGGSISSGGHNLDGDGTCNLTGLGDLPNINPSLAPLDDYGGPTRTHRLRSHSPAIDAGATISCPATDQRGVSREIDGDDDGSPGCDIGAYELDPPCASDAAVGSAGGVAIPDNDSGGASSTLEFIAPGTVTDVNVCLAIPHTWVGDLTVTLQHEDTGTSVTLLDRPWFPATTFGCSGDDIFALFDDGGGPPVEDACAASVPTILGPFTPNEPLADFIGELINGRWTLTAVDNAGGDTGLIDRWTVLFHLAQPTNSPGLSPSATPTSSAAPTATFTPTPTAVPTPTPTPSATPTPSVSGAPTASKPPPTATPTGTPGEGSVVWGDDNCSGSADPVDSLLTLRHDAGLSANTGDCPEMGQLIDAMFASSHPWGDVDCSGGVDPVDSLKILRFDAGLSVGQEAGCPEMGSEVTIIES